MYQKEIGSAFNQKQVLVQVDAIYPYTRIEVGIISLMLQLLKQSQVKIEAGVQQMPSKI